MVTPGSLLSILYGRQTGKSLRDFGKSRKKCVLASVLFAGHATIQRLYASTASNHECLLAVPIKVIANFKRVKALTKDLSAVADSLRSSSDLVVDDEGKRVRRAVALPDFDITDIQKRTVIAEHLPDTPTIGET